MPIYLNLFSVCLNNDMDPIYHVSHWNIKDMCIILKFVKYV